MKISGHPGIEIPLQNIIYLFENSITFLSMGIKFNNNGKYF